MNTTRKPLLSHATIATLVAVLSALAAYVLWLQFEASQKELRASVIAQAERRAAQLAESTSHHAELLFGNTDFALRELRDAWLVGRSNFDATVRSLQATYPDQSVVHVAVIGPDGFVVFSTRGIQARVYAGDREHFRIHADNKADTLHISKALYGRVSKDWNILISRPVLRAGAFAGVVIVGLSPKFLSEQLEKISMSAGDTIALLHSDGAYLARSPDWEDAMGKAVRPDRPFLAKDAPDSGIFRGPATLDLKPRIFGWHRLKHGGLMLVLGLSEQGILESFETQYEHGRLRVATGAALILALGIAIAVLLLHLARRESALRASESRYRALTELSSDWYWEQDEKLRFSSMSRPNAGQAEIEIDTFLGHTRRDAPGVVWDEPELSQLEAITAARKPFRDFEIGRVYRDGPKEYVRMSGEPVFDAEGTFTGYRGLGSNITERKRGERLLALEHAIARALAMEKDAASGLKAVMRAVCETMDWSRSTYWRVDEAAGVMRFGDFLDAPGANLERYTEHSRKLVFAPGQGLVGRVWQTGEPIWSADFPNDPRVVNRSLGRETGIGGVFIFPVVSEARTIGALAFFSRAVRQPDQRLLALMQVIGGELGQFLQRKEAEDQIGRLNAELEQRVVERTHALEVANQELESFSYSVSHDLRAPLRAIQGFSSLVEKQYADRIDEQGRGMLRRVGAAALKMGTLIDDLLNLSRISRQTMQLGPVDLSTLAWEVVGELQMETPARKVDWVIAARLPAQGDAGLLRVALHNLIGNAWKYSARRADARIEFGQCERNGKAAYFVRDNGAGFDASYADKLFSAFQRLHSQEEFPGTGIGLATVKRVIHRHGGEVAAEGKVGEGAVFYFTL